MVETLIREASGEDQPKGRFGPPSDQARVRRLRCRRPRAHGVPVRVVIAAALAAVYLEARGDGQLRADRHRPVTFKEKRGAPRQGVVTHTEGTIRLNASTEWRMPVSTSDGFERLFRDLSVPRGARFPSRRCSRRGARCGAACSRRARPIDRTRLGFRSFVYSASERARPAAWVTSTCSIEHPCSTSSLPPVHADAYPKARAPAECVHTTPSPRSKFALRRTRRRPSPGSHPGARSSASPSCRRWLSARSHMPTGGFGRRGRAGKRHQGLSRGVRRVGPRSR